MNEHFTEFLRKVYLVTLMAPGVQKDLLRDLHIIVTSS